MSNPITAETAPQSSSTGRTLIIAVVMLLIGVGLGYKVVAPRFGGSPAATDEDSSQEASAPAMGAPELVKLDNIIVNPRGSMGAHVMVISIAYEVADKAAKETLTYQEIPLRDAVIQALEKQSLEMLGRPGAREELKQTLAEIARKFVPKARLTVYIPQFLIQ